MLLHFHVHQDLDARLDILKNGEWIRLMQSIALICQYVFVVGVDLTNNHDINQVLDTYLVVGSDLHRKVEVDESFFERLIRRNITVLPCVL